MEKKQFFSSWLPELSAESRGTHSYLAQGAESVLPAATQARGEATLFGRGKNFPRVTLVMKMLLGGELSIPPALHLS